MRSPKIVIHSTIYCPKRILLLKCNENEVLQFGEI